MQTDVNLWLENKNVPNYLKDELLQHQNDQEYLTEAFTGKLDFGTAGMRGLMGPGTNRMNIFTIGQVTKGLAIFMDELGEEIKNRGVVICYDPRYHSKDFADYAAMILGAQGITVYLFDSIRATPELSFTIRELNTYAGIMITASHNSKEYNGYKIYGPDGGQMPPAEVDNVVKYADQVEDIFNIETTPITDLRAQGLLTLIGEDVDEKYLARLREVNIDHKLIAEAGKDLAIVYTPLHGAGNILYRRMFNENGFMNINVVAKQAIIDPEFVTAKSPNPEFPEVFAQGIEVAKQTGAQIIIATDPDADRMGCAIKMENGEYMLLTGNQMASLYANYLLTSLKENNQLKPEMEIVKSIVSSELPFAIAKDFGIKTKDVLTGFKYIGEEIEYLNEAQAGEFIFGFEESYGFLFKDFVRDKDSLQACLMIAEVAAYYNKRGMTMAEGLEEIYQKYGYYKEETRSIEMSGLDGLAKMKALMERLRAEKLETVLDQEVLKTEDYLSQTVLENGVVSQLVDYPKSDVLKYYLTDGTWVALRPSGTEPKIKIYVGAKADSAAAAADKVAAYQAFFNELLSK